MRDKGSRVTVASVTGRIARCVVARRTVARLVFGVERCSIPCDFDGFDVGAVPGSAACRSSFGAESPATRSRVCRFEGAALAPSRTTNRLQDVLVSPQVIARSSAAEHHQHVEGSC